MFKNEKKRVGRDSEKEEKRTDKCKALRYLSVIQPRTCASDLSVQYSLSVATLRIYGHLSVIFAQV